MHADTVPMSRRESIDKKQGRGTDPSGVLLIDKPLGLTSHDVVDRVRKLYRIRRVGHTGTLDPMASGLLLVLLGPATKIAPYLTQMDKVYHASITFGSVSDTGDAQGKLTPSGDTQRVNADSLQAHLRSMIGAQSQRIPAYSAVQVNGQRLYELARRGEEVPDLQRDVTVYDAELLSYKPPVAEVRFRCSSGTYVRALAESLGEAFGCGAHLSGLRREAVGRWQIEEATDLDRLITDEQDDALPLPQPIENFLDYPRVEIQADSVDGVKHGTPITVAKIAKVSRAFDRGAIVVICDAEQRVLALSEARVASSDFGQAAADEQLLRYRRVLA